MATPPVQRPCRLQDAESAGKHGRAAATAYTLRLDTAAAPARRRRARAQPPPAALDAEPWAVTEVVETVPHALGRRLVRFGVALSPTTLDEQLGQIASTFTLPNPLAPTLARLVARSAAALCVIVAARLGRPPSIDDMRAICARRGWIVCSDDSLRVVMSVDAVDIDHRRAGLDHDPGHVPWLGRRVHLELEGARES